MNDQRRQFLADHGLNPDDPIVLSASAWIDNYNDGQGPNYQITGNNAVAFIRRCLFANLDPQREGVSAFVRQGQLVWAPKPETYFARAEATGRYVTARQFTVERGRNSDIVAVCEIDHIRDIGGTPTVVTATAQANVAEWKKQQNASKGWWHNAPEWMAGLSAMHAAMRIAFPKQFSGFDESDTESESTPAGAPSHDDSFRPEPARTTSTPAPTPQPPADARETLRGPAPAAADPAPARGSAAPPLEGVAAIIAAFEDHGYSELDAESVAQRLRGCALADLDEGGRRLLIERAAPGRPATAKQWDQIVDIRDSLPPEKFRAIVEEAFGHEGADASYANTDTAARIITAGRPAVSGAFA